MEYHFLEKKNKYAVPRICFFFFFTQFFCSHVADKKWTGGFESTRLKKKSVTCRHFGIYIHNYTVSSPFYSICPIRNGQLEAGTWSPVLFQSLKVNNSLAGSISTCPCILPGSVFNTLEETEKLMSKTHRGQERAGSLRESPAFQVLPAGRDLLMILRPHCQDYPLSSAHLLLEILNLETQTHVLQSGTAPVLMCDWVPAPADTLGLKEVTNIFQKPLYKSWTPACGQGSSESSPAPGHVLYSQLEQRHKEYFPIAQHQCLLREHGGKDCST